MALLVRIGTRGSRLALWQANHVASLLGQYASPTIAEIQTAGDQVRDLPLPQIGGEGVFTKEIQRALVEFQIDVAVHSLKDLPTVHISGLVLAAVPPRGPSGDVFVSHRHDTFDALPNGATVATSSLRRRAQILNRRSDLNVVDIRGNVETRLHKLDSDNLDGLILAQAGLERLALDAEIREVLDSSWMLPAVGQGALGLECRCDDEETLEVIRLLDDPETHEAITAERAFLRTLKGGCQVPIGASAHVKDERLTLRGVVLDIDGKRRIEGRIHGTADTAEELGRQLAHDLLARGAAQLLSEV